MKTKKEFMPKIQSIKTRYRLAKAKSILKDVWSLFPFLWIINLLSRIIISGVAIQYLDSIGHLTTTIQIILFIWMLAPLHGLVNNLYYGLRELHLINKFNTQSKSCAKSGESK